MRAIIAAVGWRNSGLDSPRHCEQLTECSAGVGLSRPWKFVRSEWATLACVDELPARSRPTVALVSDDRVLVAVDARLVERETLRDALSTSLPGASDAELILAAYRRWGADFPEHLTGDFSVVVHDDDKNEVVLATGGSGARQLFYSRDSRGVFVASVAQLIQAAKAFGQADVDAVTVRDYLIGRQQDPRRTFFAEILRVPPGHQVILGAEVTHSRRHWMPPRQLLNLPTDSDYLEAFAALFQKCVADAVDRDAHHVVHLSGGLDSSSIVLTLPVIDVGRASFEILTAIYPTIRSCNETVAVASVLKRVPFPARSWNAEKSWDLERECDLSPWPLAVVPTAIGNYEDLDDAGKTGAVAVLSGDGGDGLTVETAVFRDLARHRQWRALWNELSARGLRGPLRRLLVRQSLHELLPRAWARRPTSSSGAPPRWLGPALTGLGQSPQAEPDGEEGLEDLVQRQVWSAMTDPTDMWVLETLNHRAWRAGVELRSPYRDTRLTAFVASIPYHRRVCGGTTRRLQREGLGRLIPVEVRRHSKTNFRDAAKFLIRRELMAAESMVEGEEWRATPYVRRAAFDDLCRDVLSGGRGIYEWYVARRIWTLELWLRRLAR